MFERFTPGARATVVVAQDSARFLGHRHIGTEHVLLGLLAASDDIAGRVLAGLGVTRVRVIADIERIEKAQPGAQPRSSGEGHRGAAHDRHRPRRGTRRRRRVLRPRRVGRRDRDRARRPPGPVVASAAQAAATAPPAPRAATSPSPRAPKRSWSSHCAKLWPSTTTTSAPSTSCSASSAKAKAWPPGSCATKASSSTTCANSSSPNSSALPEDARQRGSWGYFTPPPKTEPASPASSRSPTSSPSPCARPP